MRNVVLSAGSAFAALVAFSLPASAGTMKAVYTGTVSGSYDQTNEFGLGTGTGVLDGQAFTATFIYDPATPGALHPTYDDGDYGEKHLYGGPAYGVPSPVTSAVLTIGGVSHSLDL